MIWRRKPGWVTRYRVARNTLVVDLAGPRVVLSSAPRRGGLVRARYILNHHVESNPITSPRVLGPFHNAARYLGLVAESCGADQACVSLMTAVSMKDLVLRREAAGALWVEGFVTVGVSNAVRAGERPRRSSVPGTINVILVTNVRLSASALVGAVQVATESKTAALLTERVPSWTGVPGATGTGTDAIVVASGPHRSGPFVRYSGTHTRLGSLIGRLVYRGVKTGLVRYRESSRGRLTGG